MRTAQRSTLLDVTPSPARTVLRYDPTSDSNLTLSGSSVTGATDMTGNGCSGTTAAGPDRVTGASGINNVQCFNFVGANNDNLSVLNALGAFSGVSQITLMAVVEMPNFTLSNLLFNILSSVSGNRFSASITQTTGKPQIAARRRNADSAITVASSLALTAAQRAFIAMYVDFLRGLFYFQIDGDYEILRPTSMWASGRGRTERANSSGAPVFGRVGSSVLNGKVGGLRIDTGATGQDMIAAQRAAWQPVFDTGLKKLAFIEPTVGLNKVFQYA